MISHFTKELYAISRHFFFLSIVLLLYSVAFYSQNNPTQYVNPFIGTGGHGHTFPGAVLPFGMVQLSPDTRIDGSWDGCSGYHYSDSVIYGFTHTHLSGTGCSDWGDILLMPTTGTPAFNSKQYASKYSHKNEKASAGFYEVTLKNGKIKVELTVTPRVGIHRYTFPGMQQGNVLVDLTHRDKTLRYDLKMVDSLTLVGYRISEAWAKEQHVYFAIQFSKRIKSLLWATGNELVLKPSTSTGKIEGVYAQFNTKDGLPVIAKVGISFVSVDGAMNNLKAEAPHWNFEKYKKEAEITWNKQLRKIDITETNKDNLATFYTALYHCCIHPSLNMDADKSYRGRDNRIHQAENFTNYSVFSLWDTYRALHPLYTLIERKRSSDFINSFLNQYKQSSRLPVWELSSNETDCMIGFHSVSVIADAAAKGIRGFDTLAVYEAMKAASNYTGFGIPVFNNQGFLQIDDESESVSKSLEYAYDNWCVAQMAKVMKKPEEEKYFLKRSLSYKNLFDATTGNMRPRKNGNWLSPFYPTEINNHFTEGNSWQYSFYVPQDIEGLIKLHGGNENFEKKLDELFNTKEKTTGREQADVTGLIGQYAHGNEPSHHMAYLYNYVGKPQKTIERVRGICKDFYKNSVDGLIGNEDCGQMSAWYVFSSLGFYPVCPGSTQYVLSEPIFKQIVLNFENGKKFQITRDSANGKPVSGILLNEKLQNASFIEHNIISGGGKLKFQHSITNSEANYYGFDLSDRPSSNVKEVDIIPAPIIVSDGQVFKNKLDVSLKMINVTDALTIYTKDGKVPSVNAPVYNGPFQVDSNSVVKAQVYTNQGASIIIQAKYFKLKYDYDIRIKSEANSQYKAEGAQSLIDGISGDSNWRKGNWLGYQTQDFECVVDLKHEKEINEIALDCLQDTNSWIVFPRSVEYYVSNDNTNFTLFGIVNNSTDASDYSVQVKKLSKKSDSKKNARYIKIVAKNFGKLPSWHAGEGGDAFIFVDELEIN